MNELFPLTPDYRGLLLSYCSFQPRGKQLLEVGQDNDATVTLF